MSNKKSSKAKMIQRKKKLKWKDALELINEKRCSSHLPLKRNIVKISSIIEYENEKLYFNKSFFVKVFAKSLNLQVPSHSDISATNRKTFFL